MNAKDYLDELNGLHLEVQMLIDRRDYLLKLSKELNQMNKDIHERLKLAVDISELMDQATASQNDLIQFKIEALNYIDQVEHELQRIALRLRYGQQMTKKEIADKTFYSTRHITNLLNNGIEGLQEILDNERVIE